MIFREENMKKAGQPGRLSCFFYGTSHIKGEFIPLITSFIICETGKITAAVS